MPYFLFHGCDPNILYSTFTERNILNYALNDESSSSVIAKLQKAFKDGQKASNEAQSSTVRYHQCSESEYAEGDLKFMKNKQKKRGKYSQFLIS